MPGWIEFSAKICAVNSQFKVASFYFFNSYVKSYWNRKVLSWDLKDLSRINRLTSLKLSNTHIVRKFAIHFVNTVSETIRVAETISHVLLISRREKNKRLKTSLLRAASLTVSSFRIRIISGNFLIFKRHFQQLNIHCRLLLAISYYLSFNLCKIHVTSFSRPT